MSGGGVPTFNLQGVSIVSLEPSTAWFRKLKVYRNAIFASLFEKYYFPASRLSSTNKVLRKLFSSGILIKWSVFLWLMKCLYLSCFSFSLSVFFFMDSFPSFLLL